MKLNHYQILGVSENCYSEVIAAAYKALAKLYHPDRGSQKADWKKMADLNEAFEVLSDPTKRADYDKSLSDKKELEARRKKKRKTIISASITLVLVAYTAVLFSPQYQGVESVKSNTVVVLDRMISDLQNELKAKDILVSDLQNAFAAKERELASLIQEIDTKETLLATASIESEKEIDVVGKKLEEAQAELAKQIGKNRDQMYVIDNYRSKENDLKEKFEKATSENESLQRLVATKAKVGEDTKNRQNELILALEEKMESMRSGFIRLAGELGSLKENVDQQKSVEDLQHDSEPVSQELTASTAFSEPNAQLSPPSDENTEGHSVSSEADNSSEDSSVESSNTMPAKKYLDQGMAHLKAGNHLEAYAAFNVSSAFGSEEAESHRFHCAERMTPEEIKKAQDLSLSYYKQSK